MKYKIGQEVFFYDGSQSKIIKETVCRIVQTKNTSKYGFVDDEYNNPMELYDESDLASSVDEIKVRLLKAQEESYKNKVELIKKMEWSVEEK